MFKKLKRLNPFAFSNQYDRTEIERIRKELFDLQSAHNALLASLANGKPPDATFEDRQRDTSPIRAMVNFFFETGLLRHKDRTWDSITGVGMANVAEHVFRVSWLAAYLVLEEGGTEEEALLAMGIALAHDSGELRTGDQNPFMKAYVTVKELMAILDLFAPAGKFGQLMKKLYRSYKYKRKTSLAARCVKDADILDSAFELIELESTGHQYPVQSRNQFDIKLKAYATQSARNLHLKLLEHGAAARWDFRHAIESTFKQGKYGK